MLLFANKVQGRKSRGWENETQEIEVTDANANCPSHFVTVNVSDPLDKPFQMKKKLKMFYSANPEPKLKPTK